MSTVTLEEAQARLPELIAKLRAGDEVIITDHAVPVAKLVGDHNGSAKVPRLGTAKGKILYMADDFDAPLEDFKEYME
jgi:prevent-host-death family protein